MLPNSTYTPTLSTTKLTIIRVTSWIYAIQQSMDSIFPILLCLLGIGLFLTISAYIANYFGGMWVPSSLSTVRRMLTLAELQSGQTVIDLGAGDGRVVIMAARHFEAQAIGVEIDPIRTTFANILIIVMGLRQRAWVHYGSVFTFDISQADVVVMYLKKATNAKLRTQLTNQLRPGVKVVTRFAIPGWSAQLLDDTNMIFVYEVGNHGPEIETELV